MGRMPTGNPRGGQNRKPTALKMLHGDDKKDPKRINHDDPTPTEFSEPERPEGMSEAQEKEYDKVCGWLRSMKLLHAPDAATIIAYVVITEKLDRLRVRMTNEPEIVRNPSNGMPMQNPVFDQWLKACTKMEALSNKLGLNPQARSGIRTKNADANPKSAPQASPERLFG